MLLLGPLRESILVPCCCRGDDSSAAERSVRVKMYPLELIMRVGVARYPDPRPLREDAGEAEEEWRFICEVSMYPDEAGAAEADDALLLVFIAPPKPPPPLPLPELPWRKDF